MKKQFFLVVALVAAFGLALFFAGCGNSSADPIISPIIPILGPSEILQSKHAKVEKVAGGLKFTITQPSAAGFKYEYERDANGNIVYNYQYVGDGNGNFALKYEYVYVGEGNGQYKKNENGTYVPWPVGGDYACRISHYEEVGQGNGSYTKGSPRIVSYGWTNVFITIYGSFSNGYTQASLDLSGHDDEVTAFWPLCEPGKLYEFEIQIEPWNGDRESIIYERLVVAADEGLGEIEKAPKHDEIILSYDGEKPTVKVEGFEPPVGKIQNLRTHCGFFATNQSELKDGAVDWWTDGAIRWFGGGAIPGAVDEFVWDDSMDWASRSFNQIFDATGKDTLYATWSIQFDLPVETSGVYTWCFALQGKKNLLRIR